MSIELEKLERSTDLCAPPRPKLLSATECRSINTFFSYNEGAVAFSNVKGSSKKTAIHLAAESLDTYAIESLVRNKEININVKDVNGNTPLHLAVKLNRSDMVKIFLQRPDLDVNNVNENGQTALGLALAHNNQKIAYFLLTKDGIDIDKPNPKYNGKSCREIIQEKFPEMYLIILLHNRKIDEFINLVNTNRYFLDRDDIRYTYYLEYACENGLKEVVKTLLDLDVHNKCCDENIIILLQLAAFKGYYKILKLLLEHPNTSLDTPMKEGVNVFYQLFAGAKESEYHRRPDENCDYKQCLQLLLSEKVVLMSKINHYRDYNGKTVLERAACLNDNDFVKMILRPPLYICMKNKKGKYPFTMVKPWIIEESLNSCIYTNDVMDSENENYAIIYDFGMLILPADLWRTVPNLHETDHLFMKELAHFELGNRLLLQHPLFMSFIHLKWCAAKPIFLSFMVLYGFLFFFSTSYYAFYHTRILDMESTIDLIAFVFIIVVSLYGLVIMLFKRDFHPQQDSCILTSCKKWMKTSIILIILISNTFSIFMDVQYRKLSAISFLLLFCAEYLSLLGGQMHKAATFIKVFKIVSKNFFILLMLFSPLIITFTLCFFFLYSDIHSSNEKPNLFRSVELSFFKTFVMMAGGFDAESIPSESEPDLLLGQFGHMIFLVFLFFVSIVLFSSLNGLAVSDIQAIKAEAKTIGILATVKLVVLAECLELKKKNRSLFIRVVARLISAGFNWPFKQSREILFFKFLPDSKVYLYPNRNNAVITNCSDCSLDPNNPPDFFFHQYNASKMDPEIVEDSMKILEERNKVQHKEASLEDLFKEFHHKTEEQFKNEYLEKMDQFESKLHTFQNEYSQKLDHFESKSDTFRNEYSQKMDHFESKLDTFQNEYSKKIDQFNTNMTKILNLLEHKS